MTTVSGGYSASTSAIALSDFHHLSPQTSTRGLVNLTLLGIYQRLNADRDRGNHPAGETKADRPGRVALKPRDGRLQHILDFLKPGEHEAAEHRGHLLCF